MGESSLSQKTSNSTNERIFRPDDLLPAGSINVPVVSPCVFKKSGFTQRNLSHGELLDLYDVDTSLKAAVLACLEKDDDPDSILQHIVRSAPGKLVSHVSKRALIGILEASDESVNTDVRNLEGRQCDALLGGYNDAELELDLNWYKFEDENADLNDERAARADDIETEVNQWDHYIVNEFKPSEEWRDMQKLGLVHTTMVDDKPLICCGGGIEPRHKVLFDCLRKLLLSVSKRRLVRSFGSYLRQAHGKSWSSKRKTCAKLKRDLEVGRDVVSRYGASTWWDWSQGSTLHFWRWHPDFRVQARDGIPMMMMDKMQPYLHPQQWPKIAEQKSQMFSKLIKVVNRGYISKGNVTSLTGFFPVPKGDSDIRMVYDATKCGLNKTIWAPSFWLPTIDTTLSQVEIGGFMSNIDLGEMFLNFPLDRKLWPLTGVDLTEMRESLLEQTDVVLPDSGPLHLHWNRCLMGLKSSPYQAVKFFAWVEDFICGLAKENSNPFGYDKVVSNFPGSKEYNPAEPRVYKACKDGDGGHRFAANFEVYIDDIRVCGPTLRSCVKAARRIAARTNYLGVQDACRKRRFPSQMPSVWSGAKSLSTPEGLFTATTQAKWEKGKAYVAGWLAVVDTGDGMLNRKDVEKGRGFLVHLSRTYPAMVPNMKGIHHVLESWRIGQDRDGWKWSTSQWKTFLEEAGELEAGDRNWKEKKVGYTQRWKCKQPKEVNGRSIKRLKSDLIELMELFSHNKPPRP